MDTRIFKSILTIAAVVVLGGGITYAAQFQSDPVTITNSQLTAGDADMALCNNAGTNDWKASIGPSLTLGDLVPGGEEAELTAGSILLIGNDSGDLDVNGFGASVCNTYADPEGSSDVELVVTPKATSVSCEAGLTASMLDLRVELSNSNGDVSGDNTQTLAQWRDSPVATGDPFEIDRVRQVKLFASLNDTATSAAQGKTCSFDLQFTGDQPVS